MTRMVSKIKHDFFGDWNTRIQMAPLLFADDKDTRPFLQFYNKILIKGNLETMIGWSHPSLLRISSRKKLNLFVDCTFSICPAGFSQCLIFMIYEDATHLYIPIFYVLLQSKHEATYREAVHQIIRATEYQIGASSITCDFEIGLYNAIHCYFPQATPTLCLFHFKQALRRWFKKKTVDTDDLKMLIGANGLIDILCIINPQTILTHGKYCSFPNQFSFISFF
jgi:hypothetical protein